MALSQVASSRKSESPQRTTVSDPTKSPSKFRIDYVDGIRGLAALAVTIMHTFEIFGLGAHPVGVISDGLLTNHPIDRVIELFYSHFFQRANYAVEVFIVLSGYSLMLGVVRSQDGRLKGGIRGYFKRRIRRIWPPYYAALLVSLLVIMLVPGMNEKHNVWWDLALPAITPEAILSHVFFAQSLHPDTFFKINPPMWTIAVEEQIYIVFPLLLLPMWRRSSLKMLLTALIVGTLSWFIFRPYLANPWYLGLFALGATAASIGFTNRSNEQSWRQRIPWGKLSIGVFIVFVILSETNNRVDFGLGDIFFIIDTVLGLSVACMLVALTERWKAGKLPSRFSLLRLFQHPYVVWLGRFSYSLYLMHAPILAMIALLVLRSGIRSFPAYAIMMFFGVPIAVAGTYLFHLAFERPFMPALNTPKQQHAKANA